MSVVSGAALCVLLTYLHMGRGMKHLISNMIDYLHPVAKSFVIGIRWSDISGTKQPVSFGRRIFIYFI